MQGLDVGFGLGSGFTDYGHGDWWERQSATFRFVVPNECMAGWDVAPRPFHVSAFTQNRDLRHNVELKRRLPSGTINSDLARLGGKDLGFEKHVLVQRAEPALAQHPEPKPQTLNQVSRMQRTQPPTQP